MIIFESTCGEFIRLCMSKGDDSIQEIISQKMGITRTPFSDSEKRSWENSLPALAEVLAKSTVPKDAEIGIEYQLRIDEGGRSKGRIDAIICGLDHEGKESAVIIELKQWSVAYTSDKPWYVNTMGGSGEGDYWHPSYQAANYSGIMENFYAYVQDSPVILRSCSYLHNMSQGYGEIIEDTAAYPLIESCPVFLKGEEEELERFIGARITRPCKNLIYRIDASRLRPSKKLADMLTDALDGNGFFSYSEDQADAVATIAKEVRDSHKYGDKKTIIIRGRPGTGKSVVAINAMGLLMNPDKGNRMNCAYFTNNQAPRLMYAEKLIDNDYTKRAIKGLFKSPVSLVGKSENLYDCSFFDEAHRMYVWRGGTGVKKDQNVIESCIRASKVSVFFIDEDQAVTVHDYATIERLMEIADKCNSRVIEGPSLTQQFRVLGGDSYLNFVRGLLGYPDSKERHLPKGGYDVQLFDKAADMRDALRMRNDEHGCSRMVAGYTYEWMTKNDRDCGFDIVLDGGSFEAKWNMSKNDYSWLNDSGSFEDVGCIHTCQGLDMEYCGVIIGKDMRYEDGAVVYDQSMEAKSDRSSGIRTCKDTVKAATLIRNTYNVLLTRGMRGTYIYCEDQGLREHIRLMIE